MRVCVCRTITTLTSLGNRIVTGEKTRCNVLNRKMSTQLIDAATPIIAIAESNRFISECLQAVGAPKDHADAMADLLVEADYRGHYSHGMNRLDMYIKDITSGTTDCKITPKILKESPATAWVDGQNGLGAVVGNFCMDLAIKKAKEVGVGWVTTKGSNHFGIAAMYTLRAIKEGIIGLSFTNTSPFMCPTRSKEAALGTNPLSLGAPAKEGDSFLLDMATTAVAVGKIEMQRRKDMPIPEGWALDRNGESTTNAEEGVTAAQLMPLGGAEMNSGYKGFGLGFLVEIFCGILGDAQFGPNVRRWSTTSQIANLGQCFIAVNPECFAPGFEDRLSDLMNHIRNLTPVDPSKPVLIAGDPEKQHMAAVDKAGGIKYVPNQMRTCEELAKKLNVKPLEPAV